MTLSLRRRAMTQIRRRAMTQIRRRAMTQIRRRAMTLTASVATMMLLAAPTALAGPPQQGKDGEAPLGSNRHRILSPQTQFTMRPDGSSGVRPDGAAIPNIDSVKKTINTYYGDPGTGFANKTSSPYITEMKSITRRQGRQLHSILQRVEQRGEKPAIVFDADDTTLMTYDMEVAGMGFDFDPDLQDEYVQGQKFPATPSMVNFVAKAADLGFTIFGITGRNDDQKQATVSNLTKVGYTDFRTNRFFTKWTGKGESQQPDYVTCATQKCSTVEYKAGTRRHIERDLGYDIVLNVGDQWSDLMGGFADETLKLPNPTYYLPSDNLAGRHQPQLAPRTHFRMEADGSSGVRPDGEGIPNIDSVKKTINTYYGDPGTGIADKINSPYILEMSRAVRRVQPDLVHSCREAAQRGQNPAVVFDADDTTLMTYDMEVAGMAFNFDPQLQDVYVQEQRFPATPSMTSLVSAVDRAGCTVVGVTGRNHDQQEATVANLHKVGYAAFDDKHYFTKWTGEGDSQQPSYVTCAAEKCTTIEYKSQTRRYLESPQGGDYRIVANLGDQFSDLIGGHAEKSIKVPNPTYYLP